MPSRDAVSKHRQEAAAKRSGVVRRRSSSDFSIKLQEIARGEFTTSGGRSSSPIPDISVEPPPSSADATMMRTSEMTPLGKRLLVSSGRAHEKVDEVAAAVGLSPLRLLQSLDARRYSPSRQRHSPPQRKEGDIGSNDQSQADRFQIVGGKHTSMLKPEDRERLEEAMHRTPVKNTANFLVLRSDAQRSSSPPLSLAPPSAKTSVPWSKPTVRDAQLAPSGQPATRKYFYQLEEEITDLQKKVRGEVKARALLEAQLREAKGQIRGLLDTKKNLMQECEDLQRQAIESARLARRAAAKANENNNDDDDDGDGGNDLNNLMNRDDSIFAADPSVAFRSFRRQTDAVSALGGETVDGGGDEDDEGAGSYYFTRFSRKSLRRKESVMSESRQQEEGSPLRPTTMPPLMRRESLGIDTAELSPTFFGRPQRSKGLDAQAELQAEQTLVRQADEANTVRRAFGPSVEKRFVSCSKSRNFLALREMFVGASHAVFEQRAKLKQLDPSAGDSSPTHLQRQRSGSVGDGAVAVYKKQLDSLTSKLLLAQAQVEYEENRSRELQLVCSSIATAATKALHETSVSLGEYTNAVMTSGEGSKPPSVKDVLSRLAACIGTLSSRAGEVRTSIDCTSDYMDSDLTQEWYTLLDACGEQCSALKGLLCGVTDEQMMLGAYVKELGSFRDKIRQSMDAETSALLLSPKSQPSAAANQKSPRHSPLKSPRSPAGGKVTWKDTETADVATQTTSTGNVGPVDESKKVLGTVPKVIEQLMMAVALMSSVCLQAMFGRLAERKPRLSGSLQLSRLRQQALKIDGAYFPLSLTPEDEAELQQCSGIAVVLLEVAKMWSIGLSGARVAGCSAFIDLIRRSTAMRVALFYNDRETDVLQSEVEDNCFRRFSGFLRAVFNRRVEDSHGIIKQLRCLAEMRHQRAQLNWKGMLRLHRYIKLQSQLTSLLNAGDAASLSSVTHKFFSDVARQHSNLWHIASRNLKLSTEAVWSSLLRQLRECEVEAAESGFDLDLFEAIGPSALTVTQKASAALAEKTKSERLREQLGLLCNLSFDEPHYVRASTDSYLHQRFAPTEPQPLPQVDASSPIDTSDDISNGMAVYGEALRTVLSERTTSKKEQQ